MKIDVTTRESKSFGLKKVGGPGTYMTRETVLARKEVFNVDFPVEETDLTQREIRRHKKVQCTV